METIGNKVKSIHKSGKIAFEKVYDQYFFPVFRYLNVHIGNRQDAEDLAGDVFLYCFAHYAEYDPDKSAIGTWIYLVTNSRLKNYYRGKREWIDLNTVEEFLFAEGDELDHAVYLEQLRKELVSALKQLPEKYQRAVVLRFVMDWDYDRIAEELGTTEGNVRVIVSRAMKQIEKNSSQLKEFLRTEGEMKHG